MGSENSFDSSAGILIKTSEISDKSSESNALAEMLGSGEFKGCVSAADAGVAHSATMEACVEGGMHWIFTAKDNNKKAFRSIKGIFGFSGAAPLFEGEYTCFTALKPAEVLPDLPAFSGIIAKRTLDCSHGALIARDYFLALDVESLGLDKKFPGFASAGCVRTTKIPNNPYKPPEAGYRYFFSSVENLDIFAYAVRKHWCVEEYHFQVDTAMKNDENRTTASCGSFRLTEIKKVAPALLTIGRILLKSSVKRLMKKISCNCKKYLAQILGFLGAGMLSPP
jgi:hypothetical protein